MLLNNVTLVDDDTPVNVEISGSKITGVHNITTNPNGALKVSFTNALIFPGLINSHDHLDFNLFPQFGDRIYKNYTEWGKHIQETYKSEIADVLKVPLALREEWGVIKNLLCGVTTVVNHGEKHTINKPLINIHENYYCLHSVKFEKKWKLKLNNPLKRKYPVVIHIGEGDDQDAYDEIDSLLRWNKLHKNLVGVHAVAMSKEQAKSFKAIVWCPQANYFLLNKTAAINQLKEHTTILFGTDSTLTSEWNIWEHLLLARKTGMLSDAELYNALYINASTTWKTNNKEIAAGADADVVVTTKKDGKNSLDAFFDTQPKDILMVMHGGQIRLFDSSLLGQLAQLDLTGFSKINVGGACKYIQGDVPALINSILRYYPQAKFPISVS